MANERNALAELAEILGNVFCEYAEDTHVVEKAQRIVAELAKASDAIGYADEFAKDGFNGCVYIPATQQLCVKKILECRAIAEEGEVKNG